MRTIQGTTSSAQLAGGVQLVNQVNELQHKVEKLEALVEFYQRMWELSDDEIKKLKAQRAEDLYIEARYGRRTA